MTVGREYTLGKLAELLGLESSGNSQQVITGISSLNSATDQQISFYNNKRYYSDLLETRASAVILQQEHAQLCPVPVLLSENPYTSFAHATQLFAPERPQASDIHVSAVIHPEVKIGSNVIIGANTVIEANCIIEDDVHIGANCCIANDCHIGEFSTLQANVTIYSNVHIGKNAEIHAGVVLGSDGFGYASDGQQYHKIAQLGGVRIGDNVDIGAGSCIDRGALEHTVIGNGVKIDNLVQIAHNVVVGDHTVICGCSAIAGSSEIGRHCTLAGGVGIINHIKIADGVTVTAMSLVNQSIKKKGYYSSGTGLGETGEWKKNIVRFRELDNMSRRLASLEKRLDGINDDN